MSAPRSSHWVRSLGWTARLGCVLLLALAAFLAFRAFTAQGAPVVTTDKPDYFSYEKVTITGGGFIDDFYYDVVVVRPDGSIVTGDGSFTEGWDTVQAVDDGAFTYYYQLDGIAGSYEIRVYSTPWSGSLSEVPLVNPPPTFTDSPLVVDFRQCANDDPTLGDCHWINSIVQQSNSRYFEGMSVPQRLIFTNVPATTGNVHKLTLQHQAAKGSANAHAYDFLTSWSQAQAAANAIAPIPPLMANFNPCGAEIGPPGTLGTTCSGLRLSANTATPSLPDAMTNLPAPPSLTGDSIATAIANYETVFGDRTLQIYAKSTASAISGVSVTFDGYSGGSDPDALYTLTWTSDSDEILIEVAGHLAVSTDPLGAGIGYGAGKGAASVSGGPYHINLGNLCDGAGLNCASLGNQDNQIKGADILVSGNITIVKDSVPNDAQDFCYTTTGTGLSAFCLDDDAGALGEDTVLSNTKTFTGLTAGTYSVTETPIPSGWTLTSACDDGSPPSSISLSAGETVTCTYTNTKDAKITIIKDAVPDDAQNFTFTGLGGFTLDDDADGTLSNTFGPVTQAAGSYVVTETPIPAGWSLTMISCMGDPDVIIGSDADFDAGDTSVTIDLDPGEDVTCTFTDGKGALKVVKDSVPNDPQDFDFDCGSLGTFTLDDDGNGAPSNTKAFDPTVPGTYTCTETPVPSNWQITNITCTGDPDCLIDGDSDFDPGDDSCTIDLDATEDVTCTFTDEPETGTIEVCKETNPDGSLQSFEFDPDWEANFFLTDGECNDSDPLTPGTYSVSETVPPGWEISNISCLGDPDCLIGADTDFDPGDTTCVVDLDPSEDVTCNFTDTQQGNIIVCKETDPDGDPQSFGFTTDYGSPFALVDNGPCNDSGYLSPGTYMVSETVPAGWTLTSAGPCIPDGSPVSAIDLGPGETVTCTFNDTKHGTIVIVKDTDPEPRAQDFAFTCTLPIGPFTLDDDLDPMFPNTASFTVPAGPYTCSETEPGGWDFDSISCVDPDGGTPASPAPPSAPIDLDPGETVTCTFNNLEQGQIRVCKETDPNGSGQSFEFDPNWGPNFFVTDGLCNTSPLLDPGAYSVTELGPVAGWVLMSISCVDADGGTPPSPTPPTAPIDLDPGQTVTCTFNNQQQGQINVCKETDPDGSPQSFEFDPSWEPNFFLVDNGPCDNSGFLTPGTYNVTELPPPSDWIPTAEPPNRCNDGSSSSAIVLGAGEIVTCTFENQQLGKITICKDVQLDRDDPKDGFDEQNFLFSGDLGSFILDDDQVGPLSNCSITFTDLLPGSYDVTEGDLDEWALAGINCTDASPTNTGTRTVSVDLDGGEHVTCTFVNIYGVGGTVTLPVGPD